MADEKNEPSATTKALLERSRQAKLAQGDKSPVTVVEEAKPVKKKSEPKTPEDKQPAPPPVDNAHVAAGAEQFTQSVLTPPVQKNATEPSQPPQAPIPPFRMPDNFVAIDEKPEVENYEFKTKTRTMSRTEAEQERGRQIIQKNQEARRRAEAAQRQSDDDNER